MSYLGTNKIGKMYLGSTAIGKAYLGNNLVFQQGGVQPVMIPYIRGGADGSYIDTGITPDNTTKVIVWARNFNPPIASHMLFGYMDSGANTNSFGIGACGGASCGRIGVYFANYTNPYTIFENAWTCLGGYHKYELDGKVLKIDDEVKVTSTSTDTITTVHSMHLFGRSTGGTHTAMTLPADICACKIYKNGTLVRDFTAVNTPSVGLYDAVSDTVFTNSGSGSFTYGEFNENAYTPLEYIECSGAQYFDSGVYGTYSLPITSKLRSTNTTQYWMGYMGVFVSSPASCCSFTFGNRVSRNEQLSFRLGAATSDTRIFIGSSTNNLTNKDIVIAKSNNVGYTYYNNTQIGTGTRTGVATSFSTGLTMYVGATRNGQSSTIDSLFRGRIYYVGFGAQRSFVPAKMGSRVGMYDTYNDVFYPSITTPFIAGPTL